MKVLVLGVTGMLGNAVFRQFSGDPRYQVFGTLRNAAGRRYFSESVQERLLSNVDVLDQDALLAVMERSRPEVVINCVGLIKQLTGASDPLVALPINAMLPHRLCKLCALAGARLIHVSTDCVFAGRKGMYTEADVSDAEDTYGRSKFLGELTESRHAITLRTSIIGHELDGDHALIDWFLSQTGSVRGYSKAIFSGLPTVELARVMRDFVIPLSDLHGLYHVSASPIDKLSLLTMVSEVYGKQIEIVPDEKVRIDRSLDSSRFRHDCGYQPPAWPELVRLMHDLR
jgi:dTDP-4-dehydrorhamnose reductase